MSQILKAPGMVSLADSVSAGGREEQQGHETPIFLGGFLGLRMPRNDGFHKWRYLQTDGLQWKNPVN